MPTSQTSNWNRVGDSNRASAATSNGPYRRAGRKVPCARCGAKVNQWCMGGDGRPRVSNHKERNIAAGLRTGPPQRPQLPREITPERIAQYEATRAFGPCGECGVAVGEHCLGKSGPIRSCHSKRYFAWVHAD